MPAPEVTLNANSKGKATMVAVSAPKMSPLMVCLLKCEGAFKILCQLKLLNIEYAV